jgi:glycosyltransferase involved in cell wall biosynthesis
MRQLFGPAEPSLAAMTLAGNQDCQFFDLAGKQPISLAPNGSWEDLKSQLPPDFTADILVLWLPYMAIPERLWQAPLPIIGLAPDWNLLWHGYRRLLSRCDLVLTDQPGIERLARAGITNARAANLFGLRPAFPIEAPRPEIERDIDVLFAGNVHPAVQRERNAWLGRLARFKQRYNIVIHGGLLFDNYRALLSRAKIVFNHSVRGECNQRVFETAAAGALLLQERENGEVPLYLKPGVEYVTYGVDDLEQVIEHYLSHPEERQAVARAAHARVAEFTFATLWSETLAWVGKDLPALRERAARRAAKGPPQRDLAAALWPALSGAGSAVLQLELADWPDGSAKLLAAALFAPTVAEAAARFEQALAFDPANPVLGLNAAETLSRAGRNDAAVLQARQSLFHLERTGLSQSHLDIPHYPGGFDLFRVEWERAAWGHAGDTAAEATAKHALLRSRLHGLLAELTGDLAHFHESAMARPDLATNRAALGCGLARVKRVAEALPHLKVACQADPFDRLAANAFFQVLTDAGDLAGRSAFAHRQLDLHRAAPELIPLERWFELPPPSGAELASIIILCCNTVEMTKLCLDSVLKHTPGAYELIVVDNGSTDETPQLLDAFKAQPGPTRVEVIRNDTNRGYPAGVNQGLVAAKGEYLILLNNDVVVTPGWLDGLIAWSLRDQPRVGMVGPHSNYAPPPQLLQAGYQDLSGLDAFARKRRREESGKALQVQRLTGFCLLIRRPALEAIGGKLDEDFGIGFFEDDDLCQRVRHAGFALLVAQDVYVHHFGSRTFKALSIDTEAQLRANFEKFRAKWGEEAAAGYRLNGQAPSASTAPALTFQPDPAINVSLFMIVKNEEHNLAACLEPLKDVFDEIVIADTGSTDRTCAIAESFGARVIDAPWRDSFSAARNAALAATRGKWAFWMDADDRIDPENLAKLKDLFGSLKDENSAYVMKCLCVARAPGETATVVDHLRLFRNDSKHRWTFRVHEQILPALRVTGADVRWSNVVVLHTGYTDPVLRRKKLDRDLRLLNLELAERPGHPFTLFNLGSVSYELGRPAEALPIFRESLAKSHPKDSIVRKLYAFLAQCHRQLGQHEQALAACREGRRHYPSDAELLFEEAILLRESGDLTGAESCLRKLLDGPNEAEHFASVDTALRSYKARHNLAVVCRQQGRVADAETQWRAALEEEPAFLPSHLGLGELYLDTKNWSALQGITDNLNRLGTEAATAEAEAFLGRELLTRQQYKDARLHLRGAAMRFPQALNLRVLLTHALLKEGINDTAAEAALRDVLNLAPDHVEAKHNLAVLLAKRQPARA